MTTCSPKEYGSQSASARTTTSSTVSSTIKLRMSLSYTRLARTKAEVFLARAKTYRSQCGSNESPSLSKLPQQKALTSHAAETSLSSASTTSSKYMVLAASTKALKTTKKFALNLSSLKFVSSTRSSKWAAITAIKSAFVSRRRKRTRLSSLWANLLLWLKKTTSKSPKTPSIFKAPTRFQTSSCTNRLPTSRLRAHLLLTSMPASSTMVPNQTSKLDSQLKE